MFLKDAGEFFIMLLLSGSLQMVAIIRSPTENSQQAGDGFGVRESVNDATTIY